MYDIYGHLGSIMSNTMRYSVRLVCEAIYGHIRPLQVTGMFRWRYRAIYVHYVTALTRMTASDARVTPGDVKVQAAEPRPRAMPGDVEVRGSERGLCGGTGG